MRGRLASRPARAVRARGREAGRERRARAAGHQPGHLGLWRRPAPCRNRRGARPHHRSRARAGAARGLGAAALCLSLPPCRRADPADGRGAGAALSRHSRSSTPRPPCCAPCAGRRTRPRCWSGWRDGGRSARTSRSARPSSSASPARPRTISAICSTGWRRRSSTGSAASSTRTCAAPRRTTCRPRAPRGQAGALGAVHGRHATRISAAKLAAKVGRRLEAIVDRIDPDGAVCRTWGDAPEIDGNLFIDDGFAHLAPGDVLTVEVDEASDYDLWAGPPSWRVCRTFGKLFRDRQSVWRRSLRDPLPMQRAVRQSRQRARSPPRLSRRLTASLRMIGRVVQWEVAATTGTRRRRKQCEASLPSRQGLAPPNGLRRTALEGGHDRFLSGKHP